MKFKTIFKLGCLSLFGISCGNNFDKSLVMVSSSSLLDQELLTDPRYLHEHRSPDGRSYRVFSSLSLQEMEWLSLALHSDGGACGHVIYRRNLPSYRLLDQNEWLSPSFHPTIYLDEVASLLKDVDKERIYTNITSLVELQTRHHNTVSGLATTALVSNLFTNAAQDYAYEKQEVGHWEFHSDVQQKSLVVKVTGREYPDEIVIVGAHLDSIYGAIHETDQSLAPGADDNATGIATIVEIFKVFAENNTSFDRTIEFHAYAAEEIGLIGSGHLAEQYAQQGKKVVAMIQFDMNGYSPKPGEMTIYFPTNSTQPHMRRFGKEILKTYLGGDYSEGALSSGTSDHASWYAEGYPALFPFEHLSQYNRHIHTRADTIEALNNQDLTVRFTKFGVASAAHLAGLQSARPSFMSKMNDEGLFPGKPRELYTAVRKTTTGYVLHVSASPETKTVELCETNRTKAQGCAQELFSLTEVSFNNERRFFMKEWTDLQVEMRFRITSYDNDDKLIAARDIILKEK